MRSDAYELGDDFAIRVAAEVNASLPRVELDPRYYGLVADFDARFRVIPSLAACRGLQITGDVLFDQPVRLRGRVQIVNNTAQQVPVRQAELSGSYIVEEGRLVTAADGGTLC